jgi:hypothetical protein
MRDTAPLDRIAFALAFLLTVAAALAVAWWYGFGWRVMARPFALPLFFAMFASAIGMPAYYILRYLRKRKH